jgi:TonB family protein
MAPDPITNRYELTDELARLSLPAAGRDSNRKFAWMNSICILFLLVGIVGARSARIPLKPAPPLEEIMPVILEPAPPPQIVAPTENEKQNEQPPPAAPNVVVVVPNAPNINFSVPTIGSLVAPSALAKAPPLNPLQPLTPVNQPGQIANTGSAGLRPRPPYPRIAEELGQQGTVTFLLSADADGHVASVKVKVSSGSSLLDHGAADFIRRRWTLPEGASTNQLFETSITYRMPGMNFAEPK